MRLHLAQEAIDNAVIGPTFAADGRSMSVTGNHLFDSRIAWAQSRPDSAGSAPVTIGPPSLPVSGTTSSTETLSITSSVRRTSRWLSEGFTNRDIRNKLQPTAISNLAPATEKMWGQPRNS